jgi:hypothetical protein
LGGWPGVCEDDQCHDDGTPRADLAPPEAARRILQHQLRSPTCSTDLVHVTVEYPQNTGHPKLDDKLAKKAAALFASAKRQAMVLTCNDFYGCEGHCLPVGFETRYWLHQSSPNFLSVFEVERFFGNFRRNRHVRGTVAYRFYNYSLQTGDLLTVKDLFAAKSAVPRFWEKVDQALTAAGNCPSDRLTVGGRRPSRQALNPNDLLLTRFGATLALWSRGGDGCLSQAVDLSVEELLDAGFSPALWGR